MEAVSRYLKFKQRLEALGLTDKEIKTTIKQVRAEVIKQLTSAAGSAKSAKKAKSSRENGKLGGRPKKTV